MAADAIQPFERLPIKSCYETTNLSLDSFSKCGELFVSNTADKWTLFCSFCQKASNDIGVFICHIRLEHLDGRPELIRQQTQSQHTPEVEIMALSTTMVSNVNQPPELNIQLGTHESEQLDVDILKNKTDDCNQENTTKIISSKVTTIFDIGSFNSNETEIDSLEQNLLENTCEKLPGDFFTITLLNKDKHQPIVQVQGATIDSENQEFEDDDETISCYSLTENDIETETCDEDPEFIGHSVNRNTSRNRKENSIGPMPHACNLCPQSFITKEGLLYHLDVIHDKYNDRQNPFKCMKCKRSFRSRNGLRIHCKKNHEEKCYRTCPICKTSHLDYLFVAHVLTHKSKTCFPCQVCGKLYASNEERIKHWQTHVNKFPYFCKICYRRFGTQRILMNHLKTHNQYKCNFCACEFTSIESKIAPFVCPICEQFQEKSNKEDFDYSISQNDTDKKHNTQILCSTTEEISDKNDIYVGPGTNLAANVKNMSSDCTTNKTIDTNDNSAEYVANEYKSIDKEDVNVISVLDSPIINKRHLSTKEMVATKKSLYPIKCRFCNQSFKSQRGLYSHTSKMHKELKLFPLAKKFPYKCSYCSQSFISKQGVYYHTANVHKEDKFDILPFKCNECKKRFKTLKGYQLHTLSHDKKSYLKCPMCPVKQYKRHLFIAHLITHESSNCFPCQVCGKIFKTDEERIQHWNEHGKEKPYFCQVCSRRYRKQQYLTHHLKSHNKYVCNFCLVEVNTSETQRSPYACKECLKMPDIKQKVEYQRSLPERYWNEMTNGK